ncbi:FecCD family ABC transporter permease [Acerihabitans arboris]|uniref:Iron chelate uptake ABC transporter family permease subunit n=1 Tax=Acerihabitans arboris TaxID=2691583 RepID=A0A845SQN2_9GAMM|nr:iron ABC transporter permease [Acerihabitans arboris]NDL63455.1 iron chelate uptake ABC transporter family permease subunit [Acerihabitans arboris]
MVSNGPVRLNAAAPWLLAALTLAIVFLSLGVGQFSLSPLRVLHQLAHPFHAGSLENQVIWAIRMPRILTACLAGGALALCGATLQGIFHNPLVDPHIIGVSAGAAFGGTLAILLGLAPPLLLASTFCFGLLALLLVYLIAATLGRENRLMLILAGIILGGFFAALVSLLQYLADTEEKLPSIVFWLLGSFATANWHKLLMLFVPAVCAGGLLYRLRWRVNILSLGDADARALGMPVVNLRRLTLVLCAVLTAAQVAVSGSIGWIGLVIPHLARMLVGADHRRLLPTAFWLGGAFMVLVDDLARTLSEAEIPLGILTALLGAPLFAWQLIRDSREEKR